jgi:hypothetical protein
MMLIVPMLCVVGVAVPADVRDHAQSAHLATDGGTVYLKLAGQGKPIVVLRAGKGERFVGSGKGAALGLSPDRHWMFAQFTRDGMQRFTVLDYVEGGGLGYMGGPESLFGVFGGQSLAWARGEPETLLITDAGRKVHRVDLLRAWKRR